MASHLGYVHIKYGLKIFVYLKIKKTSVIITNRNRRVDNLKKK